MYTRTPNNISKPIKKLAKQLVDLPNLIYVIIVPEAFSILNECYENVRLKIAKDGGNIQYGWQIWEWPNIYIEAEFHAVWVSTTNELIDVTPKDYSVERILFLPDPIRIYHNHSIDNERRPLWNDKLIRDFLRSSKEIARLKIEGETPGNPNETTVDQREYAPWAVMHDELIKMIANNCTENSLCFCGSNKSYKNCCSL
jgi:hypothetical protein